MISLPRSCFFAILLLPFGLPAQTVRSFQTTSDLSSTLAPQPELTFSRSSRSAPITIAVDDTERYQTMDGFGASMTDGAAWLIHDRLSPRTSRKVMTQLFDPKQGIGLSFLRQPIGSTDLSRSHFSFDDVPTGQQDPKLLHFSDAHDDEAIFPLVRDALKLNPSITVLATPWSPPAWMKTKQTMDGGQLRDDAMPAYAEYLVKSVQAFKAAGIPVKYLTVQNEPLHDTTDFPGTYLPAAQAGKLIGQYLGPDLERAKLSTRVLAYDHNWDHPEYPLSLLSDPSVARYVAGSALHCYGGEPSAQTAIHNRFPDKGVWMTECSGGSWQKESPMLTTTHLLIDSTRNWAKSVVLWGIALDTDHNPHDGGCGTCRGLVTVDLKQSPATVAYTGDYYALGHASRFVLPGATRIGSSSPGRQSLESVAFENTDGSIALLVLNNLPDQQKFDITWHGHTLQASLPAGALATYVWSTK